MHALAITEQGLHVHVEGETLLLRQGNQLLRRVRLAEVNEVLLFGRIEVSSAALAALVRRKVDVVYLTQQGSFRARLAGPGSASAALRLQQLRRALDTAFCVRVARALALGKVLHQRQLLLRVQRRLQDEELAHVLGRLRLLGERLRSEDDLEVVRGLEGMAAALYFGQFGKLLLSDELTFAGRNRRPPRDPINACLSFGYALLGTVVEAEVLRCGLDPLVGFFHQPHPGRSSLTLDVLEEFRPFVDALVLRLVNRQQLGPVDFERRGGPELAELLAAETGQETAEGSDAIEGVYLAETGRRVFLTEFYRRLREPLFYPPRQGSYELRDVMREQVYHLARVIRGEDEDYVAFVPG